MISVTADFFIYSDDNPVIELVTRSDPSGDYDVIRMRNEENSPAFLTIYIEGPPESRAAKIDAIRTALERPENKESNNA